MKNYLVTGGLGFIGSHLVEDILTTDPKATVWIVDDGENASWNPMKGRLDHGNIRNLLMPIMGGYDQTSDDRSPRLVCVSGDCAHTNILSRIRAGHFCGVFHLAADVSVVESIEKPIATLEQNVKKSLLIARACAEGKTKFVFSSSAAVYGYVDVKIKEHYQSMPTNPYGLSKSTVESWLRVYSDLYGLDWVSLRYFNVYGPRQRGGSPYAGVIGNWIHNAYWNKPLTLYGDGTQVRDFVYVKDIAKANILAMKCPPTKSPIYNICTGQGVNLNKILDLIVAGDDSIEIIHEASRKGEVPYSVGDPFRAQQILGWSPNWSLSEGITATKFWRGI